MCLDCFEEYGSPATQNDKVSAAVSLIRKVYEYNDVGSNLHIVLDDWNLEDCHIQWCLDDAIKTNTHNSTEDQLATEIACAELLLTMSLDERASVLRLTYD